MSCKYPGCPKPVFEGHEFCGRTHGRMYEETRKKEDDLVQRRMEQLLGSQRGSASRASLYRGPPPRSKTKCAFPPCPFPAVVGHEFCSQTCAAKERKKSSSSLKGDLQDVLSVPADFTAAPVTAAPVAVALAPTPQLALGDEHREELERLERERQRLEQECQRLEALRRDAELERLQQEESERLEQAKQRLDELERLAELEVEQQRQRRVAEKQEKERLKQEKLEQQKRAAEEAERDRLERERGEQQRRIAEQEERDRLERERIDQQKRIAEQGERNRVERERVEQEERERAEEQKRVAEIEDQRREIERAEMEARMRADELKRIAERAEMERLELERAALEKEKALAEQKATVEEQRLAAEQQERDRLEMHRAIADRAEKEKLQQLAAESRSVADKAAAVGLAEYEESSGVKGAVDFRVAQMERMLEEERRERKKLEAELANRSVGEVPTMEPRMTPSSSPSPPPSAEVRYDSPGLKSTKDSGTRQALLRSDVVGVGSLRRQSTAPDDVEHHPALERKLVLPAGSPTDQKLGKAQKQLKMALKDGKLDEIDSCLGQTPGLFDAPVIFEDRKMASTCLGYAVYRGRLDVVDFLLQRKMTSEGVGFEVPKAKTISPWALLFLDSHFSVVGRTEVAKKLLSKAVNPLQLINSNCDDFENTALHLACSKGFAELSGWLIDNGARANLLNSLGFVPFEMATASVRGTLWKNEPLARFSFALSLVRGSGLALMENEMAKVRLRVVSPQGHVLEDRVIESCLAPAFTESGDVINVVWHDTVMLSASSMQDIVMLRVHGENGGGRVVGRSHFVVKSVFTAEETGSRHMLVVNDPAAIGKKGHKNGTLTAILTAMAQVQHTSEVHALVAEKARLDAHIEMILSQLETCGADPEEVQCMQEQWAALQAKAQS